MRRLRRSPAWWWPLVRLAPGWPAWATSSPSAEALTLDELVERCGGHIDLLKFDIEGMELEI